MNNRLIVKFIIIYCSFSLLSYSNENRTIQQYFDYLLNLEYQEASLTAKKAGPEKLKEDLIILSDLLYYNGQEDYKIINYFCEEPKDNFHKSIINLNQGYYLLYHNKEKTKAYEFFYNAYISSKNTKNQSLIKFCLLSLLEFYHYEYSQTNTLFRTYLQEFKELSSTPIDQCWFLYQELYFDYKTIKTNRKKSLLSTTQLEKQIEFLDADHNFRALFYSLKAVQLEQKDTEQSILLHQQVIEETKNLPFLKYLKFRTHIRLSEIYYRQQNYEEGLRNVELAKKYIDLSDTLKAKVYLYKYASQNNYGLKECDVAYTQLIKSIDLEHQLQFEENSSKISELNIKLETTEKEKQIVQLLNTNLKSEASRIRNRNLLLGSISLLALGFIIGVLIYKNTKRKQLIVEQNHELQLQRTEKLLKDQELNAIDAMLTGQEKERQRLANDLHDNLGSTLATIKLHFEHLKNNRNNTNVKNIEELYSKTNVLLDEAYLKVRNIAHEKNSGVMANEGLLPAIRNLAKKASSGDKLNIEIQGYGLEKRLDNALEISIFRMIQELTTNAIKHAQASEINIALTNHDSLLNIIVEDNGKGFDAKLLPDKEGMGLKSIEKRIEHLEGTFEIDSTIGKGTNILINIPI